jgi:hypothetical protein
MILHNAASLYLRVRVREGHEAFPLAFQQK